MSYALNHSPCGRFLICHTPDAADLFRRRIESIDRQIDALMCDLYALTEEEIKVVEGDELW